MLRFLVGILFTLSVRAAALAAPSPTITAAPLLRRQDGDRIYGWWAETDGSTFKDWHSAVIFGTVTYLTTSGSFYDFVAPSDTRTVPFYSCGSGTFYYASTTTICAHSCGSDVLFSTFGASDPLTRLICRGSDDENAVNGITLYAESPTITPTILPPAITTTLGTLGTPETHTIVVSGANSTAIIAISSHTTTSTLVTSSASTTSSGSHSTSSAPNGSSDRPKVVGIIAGAVIGGIALIGVFATIIIFLLRWDRRGKALRAAQSTPDPPMSPITPYERAELPEFHAVTPIRYEVEADLTQAKPVAPPYERNISELPEKVP